MGFHLRGELFKILIGGNRAFRRSIRFAKAYHDGFYLSPSHIANGKAYYNAREVKVLDEMRYRFHKLMYWRELLEAGMTRKDAAARVGHHFDLMGRRVFRLFEACFGHERVGASRGRRDAIFLVWKGPARNRDRAEAGDVERALREIADRAVAVLPPTAAEADGRVFDIGGIAFEKLRPLLCGARRRGRGCRICGRRWRRGCGV